MKNVVSKNGVWKTAPLNDTPSGGMLVVHDVDGTLDKTWQEINDADFAVILAYGSNIEAIAHMPVNFCNGGKGGTYDVACMLQGAAVYYSASSASGYPTLDE